jgi:hypothetical protein
MGTTIIVPYSLFVCNTVGRMDIGRKFYGRNHDLVDRYGINCFLTEKMGMQLFHLSFVWTNWTSPLWNLNVYLFLVYIDNTYRLHLKEQIQILRGGTIASPFFLSKNSYSLLWKHYWPLPAHLSMSKLGYIAPNCKHILLSNTWLFWFLS